MLMAWERSTARSRAWTATVRAAMMSAAPGSLPDARARDDRHGAVSR